jgi:hypothetical protein
MFVSSTIFCQKFSKCYNIFFRNVENKFNSFGTVFSEVAATHWLTAAAMARAGDGSHTRPGERAPQRGWSPAGLPVARVAKGGSGRRVRPRLRPSAGGAPGRSTAGHREERGAKGGNRRNGGGTGSGGGRLGELGF